MKTPKLLSIIIALLFIAAINNNAYSQCQAYIKVDGKLINASQISSNGLTLPLWLQEGQSIAADQMVNSISVIEFNINSTTSALEFSQVLSVTTVQTVPNDKVWKVESILKTTSSLSDVNGAVFSNGGTYNFTVPTCASYICIEVWGAGGGGSTSATGGGGGGGAYGQSCFSVLPGTQLTVVVGNAGDFNSSGGSTSVSGSGISTISVAGGSGGSGTSGGAGGSSITNATVAIPGGNGASSAYVGNSEYFGGNGGAAGGGPINSGGNGGIGGYYKSGTTILATAAGFPGGGGGGKGEVGAAASKGAHGKVIITW